MGTNKKMQKSAWRGSTGQIQCKINFIKIIGYNELKHIWYIALMSPHWYNNNKRRGKERKVKTRLQCLKVVNMPTAYSTIWPLKGKIKPVYWFVRMNSGLFMMEMSALLKNWKLVSAEGIIEFKKITIWKSPNEIIDSDTYK